MSAVDVAVVLRARAMSILGSVALYRGQYAEAKPFLLDCVALSRQFDDDSNLARSLSTLGRSLWLAGDAQRATDVMKEALRLGRQLGDPVAYGLVLMHQAEIAQWQSQHDEASTRLRECLDLLGWPARNQGLLVGAGLARLGRSAYLNGDSRLARTSLACAFGALRASQQKGFHLAEGLESLAALEGDDGQPIRAARLFGAAETRWLACGAVRHWPAQPAYERDVARVRAQLEETQFESAWAEGRAMRVDQILDYALEDAPAEEVYRPA
jgi:ATP/maltotriose-dependent transcriptional regulator MalT